MSSIRATRLGFIYQDKFALLQYLSLLQAGKKVLEFFVDYPRASSQKSIDIRIIEEVAGKYVEHIYEVKTGQSFKLDKKYKGTSEIREAITNIKDYCKDKKDIYTTIVISPELKGKVSSYWDSIQAIEGSSAFQGSVINSCEQLVRLLQISDLNDARGLYKFCKNVQIHICDSYSDIPNGDDTNASPMDNQIIAILREFNDIFKVDAFEYELPPSLLYHSLLHTLSYKVGTAENIYVFPQVHLITLLDHKIKGQSWRGAFRHIDEKSVDFVICDKNYIKPLLAIELDDRTHSYESRMLRDEEVNHILQDAQLPLLRFENHGNFKKDDIKNRILSILSSHPQQIITQ